MVSLAPLEKSLRDAGENQMVRHEAAEAIGAISEESATPVSHTTHHHTTPHLTTPHHTTSFYETSGGGAGEFSTGVPHF